MANTSPSEIEVHHDLSILRARLQEQVRPQAVGRALGNAINKSKQAVK